MFKFKERNISSENNQDLYTTPRMNRLDNQKNEISNSNIKLHFINDNENFEENEEEDEDYNNYLFGIEEDENALNNINRGDDETEKEKQLEYLYHKYVNSYRKKKYANIIKDVGNKKYLICSNSPMSFNIFLLKIRCLLKFLKKDYIKMSSNSFEKKNFLEITKKVTKIQKEFEFISTLINPNNRYNYEILTQLFCKYLLYLSLISKLKEEYIKSFSYLIMGDNSLKIYFIKQGKASDIKTYLIYCQTLLLIINQLIGNNNYEKAILYCNTNFKVIEVAFKFMKHNNTKQKFLLNFIEYIGFNYLFIGLCLEQRDININNFKNYNNYLLLCLEAYKGANYFFKISEAKKDTSKYKFSLTKNNENENIPLFLSEVLINKVIKKFGEVKILRELRYKQIEKHKKSLEDEKEKKMRLQLVANGFNKNYNKFKPVENNINKNILTNNIKNSIERLDNELISVIYKDTKSDASKRPLSSEIKKNLCQLKIYNTLMSNKFRDFVLKNKYFHFNNPIKQKESIEKLQRYLNSKIEINICSDSPKSKKKSFFTNKIILKKKKLNKIRYSHINIFPKKMERNKDRKRSKSTINIFNSFSLKRKRNDKNKNIFLNYFDNNNNNKNIRLFNNMLKSQFNSVHNRKTDLKKTNYKHRINKNKSANNIFNNKYSTKKKDFKRIKSRIKIKKYTNSFLENDFERKYLDKKLLSGKYFKKFFYLDSLTTKELSFQKKMLDLKSNNSKLFLGDNTKELRNGGKITREEAYKDYLILNDKAQEEANKLQLDNFKNEKTELNIFDDSTNVLKVLKRYIARSKEKKMRRIKIYSESFKDIKRNNDEKLLNLNNGIKELNFMISYKNKKLKNLNFNLQKEEL